MGTVLYSYSLKRRISDEKLRQGVLLIGNTVIQKLKTSKYLGLELDENLSFTQQVDCISRKLLMYAGIFSKIRWNATLEVRKQLYYAFVLPLLNFAIETYGSANITCIKKLQTLQNRILKILLFKEYRTSSNILHSEFGVLKIKDLYRSRLLNYAYNYMYNNNKLPDVMKSKLTYNRDCHSYHCQIGNL